MSHTVETIERGQDWRVRIVLDEDPSEPYDDGGSPVVGFTYKPFYDGWAGEQVTSITSYTVHPQVIEAASRFGPHNGLFERYLAAFHGVTQVRWHSDRSGTQWATFDPADWREMVGAPERSVSMDEWEAYLDGSVYGYVVERRVTWKPIGQETDDVTMDTWEHVDSLWGFFGFGEYLKDEATQALESAAS